MSPNASRCEWGRSPEIYQQYHDEEWGVPLHDDRALFEFLTLETFQSGLSWLTVLKKRVHFQNAFDGFDPARIVRYDEAKILSLREDKGIIRNRAKIEATIQNAEVFLAIQKAEGSFDKWIWSFVGGRPIVNHFKSVAEVPPSTPLADRISAELKDRGFKFIGPTVMYAHMQATGMVNDHMVSCFRHSEVQTARR